MSKQKYKKLLYLLLDDINLSQKTAVPLNKSKTRILLNKKETELIEYSVIEKILYRNHENDRIIPVDTLTLNVFNRKTKSNVETAEIHYGPNSDELARSHHAKALTIGYAIYFRSNAYKPETEEGRKTLLHELTHVAQNKEDILEGQRPVNELEREAVAAEKSAEYNPEKYRELVFNGKTYSVSEKQYRQIMNAIKENVEYAVEHNTGNYREEEYLKILLAYKKMEENGEFIWQK